MRLYEMFIGDFEKTATWSSNSIKGCKRFLERIWTLAENVTQGDSYSKELEIIINKTIKKVSEDIENLKFNTAIAALMTLLNQISEKGSINRAEIKTLLILLNPFAPHLSEELWAVLGFDGMLSQASWPSFDEAKCSDDMIEIVLQINGKVKDKILVAIGTEKDDAINAAKKQAKIIEAIEGKTIIKEIFVPNKIVNIVIK